MVNTILNTIGCCQNVTVLAFEMMETNHLQWFVAFDIMPARKFLDCAKRSCLNRVMGFYCLTEGVVFYQYD